ncbi:citryl-CoA lyase [Corynebacterium comes]|uniref:citrate synthase (unknown stereospecificity) n=1 Tax=Corynebacterium comes TaxID=2675218 RepID=A0A6B8W354_9CORY|nr:citryl-CoA lyase [Corynebacterium comes]QGU05875.1 Citrate synthase 1 [Corynebacterium comes]
MTTTLNATTGPVTRIAKSDASSITIAGHDLCQDLMGKRSFTEMIYFFATGRFPDIAEQTVLDGCLVSLMEHGWTLTSIITRLTAASVPDESQAALAAGLLSVGPKYAGTMEGCAALLLDAAASDQPVEEWAAATAADHLDNGKPLPGFGHRVHKPVDPRAQRLLEIAREQNIDGPHLRRLLALEAAVEKHRGRPLPVNATGLIGALFLEIDIPLSASRALATVSRAGGLVSHLVEEERDPMAQTIWKLVRENIPYSGEEL